MRLASIKLDSINKAVDGLTSAVKEANLIATNIGKKVREANVRLRERISNANKDFQKRLDSQRKKQREELIEALGIGGAMRRTGQVIKNTAKGFLGRIMEFLSVVLIGWAVMNIPKIIKGAQSLIGRLKKFYEVGEKIVGDLTQFLTNFGTELSQIFSNLLGFDFKPLQDKISSIMTKLQNDFRTVERGLIRDVSNLIDLNENDIAQMMGSNQSNEEQVQSMDQTIYDQGIDKQRYDALPDTIKTALRVLAKRNMDQGKDPFDEFDLEDLRKAKTLADFEQVLKDNRFVLREIGGVEYYVPPELGNIKNLEEDIMDGFNKFMNGPDYNKNDEDKKFDKEKNKEISFNTIKKNDRQFQLDKKSKDIFIPINDVNTSTLAKNENKQDSLQLNSDNNNGIYSLDNQILTQITA